MFILVENRRMRNIMTAISLTREVYPESIIAWMTGAFVYCMPMLIVLVYFIVLGLIETNLYTDSSGFVFSFFFFFLDDRQHAGVF